MPNEWQPLPEQDAEALGIMAQHSMTHRLEDEIEQAMTGHRHYWLAMVSYAIEVPLTEGMRLDSKSMRVPPLVGCYICETPYRPGLERTRCLGESR